MDRFTQTRQVSGFCSTVQEEAGAQNQCLVKHGAIQDVALQKVLYYDYIFDKENQAVFFKRRCDIVLKQLVLRKWIPV